MKIYGRNAVEEALKAGTTVEKLMIQEDAMDASASRLMKIARDRGVRVVKMPKKALDLQITDGGKHQGFIIETTEYNYYEVSDILAFANEREEDPFIIILDGLEDPHNLGSILRVAETSGVHGVIIPARRAVGVNETVVRTSAGASAHVKVAKVGNINDEIIKLKEQGVWVYAADMDGAELYSTNLMGGCALVIGAEGAGVKRLTRELCDGIISIPMFGQVNSLNASVATGIVVYERVRQIINSKK